MAMQYSEELTPREREEMDFTSSENEKNRAFELEKARLTNELAKIEQRWNQLFRIPILLVMLPVRLLLCLVLPVAILRGGEHVERLLAVIKS